MDFLKGWQNALYPQSNVPIDTLPHRSVGGWDGWERVIGFAMLLRVTGDSIKLYSIFDSDYHTPSSITKRRERANEDRINLHIWSRKEIENYLLVPSAIGRLIERGVRKGVEAPGVEEISAQLEVIAEDLWESVFNGFAEEFLKEDRPHGISGANKKATELLRSEKRDAQRKLARVSGKEVIHKMSAWSQGRFFVPLSAFALSRELQREELDPEVRGVIEAIEYSLPFSPVAT
jgi:hypothetical protein